MELFASSRAWLLEAGRAVDPTSSAGLAALLRVIVGLWLCEAGSPAGGASEVRSVADRLLGPRGGAPDLESLRGEPELVLLSQAILHRLGLEMPALEQFAASRAAALQGRDQSHTDAAAEIILLSRLGYCRPPPTGDWLGQSGVAVLGASSRDLRAVCRTIFAATHFGLRAPRDDPRVVAELREDLAPVLLEVLRGYNLDLGATILRALLCLRGPRTRPIRLATAFVRDQQQPDGRFGYLEIEIAAAEGLLELDPVADLYLPTTVSCLWTLAEALIPRFRLVSSATSRTPAPT